ncbi:MAG TPA: molecular chaperone TorD family protein [Thermoanaerobaculia bacterium]|nr:molecular chaperone TorD family protein [Thermoanaerobaculia bacterium]
MSRDAFARLASRFRYPATPELQAIYTSTFDLAPACSPYLGTHLFGDDSRDRARLMVGLRGAGVRGQELPDHIAEVLAFAPKFSDEEWRELVPLVLEPALRKMDALLRETTNPYRHAVAEALALCRGETSC